MNRRRIRLKMRRGPGSACFRFRNSRWKCGHQSSAKVVDQGFFYKIAHIFRNPQGVVGGRLRKEVGQNDLEFWNEGSARRGEARLGKATGQTLGITRRELKIVVGQGFLDRVLENLCGIVERIPRSDRSRQRCQHYALKALGA